MKYAVTPPQTSFESMDLLISEPAALIAYFPIIISCKIIHDVLIQTLFSIIVSLVLINYKLIFILICTHLRSI